MAEADTLARFLVERHFVRTKQLVKPRAFLPELYDGTLTTSVFDADGLSDDELWNVGIEHVADPRGKPLYGHAELQLAAVLAAALSVRSAEPPPRHRELIGWSTDKEDQLSVSRHAILKLRLVA